MQTLKKEEAVVGLRVVFVDHALNAHDASYVSAMHEDLPVGGKAGIIVGFGDGPGKQIVICLKEPIEKGHTCDGFTPDKHGVWARPEHLYTEEAYAAHKAAYDEAVKASAVANAEKAKAADIARAYLAEDGERATQTIAAADVGVVPADVTRPKARR